MKIALQKNWKIITNTHITPRATRLRLAPEGDHFVLVDWTWLTDEPTRVISEFISVFSDWINYVVSCSLLLGLIPLFILISVLYSASITSAVMAWWPACLRRTQKSQCHTWSSKSDLCLLWNNVSWLLWVSVFIIIEGFCKRLNA